MADSEGTASNAIWAVALVIIVAMTLGAVYYLTQMNTGGSEKKIDINVTAPAR